MEKRTNLHDLVKAVVKSGWTMSIVLALRVLYLGAYTMAGEELIVVITKTQV